VKIGWGIKNRRKFVERLKRKIDILIETKTYLTKKKTKIQKLIINRSKILRRIITNVIGALVKHNK